jgi:D-threonine aldolase
MGDNWYQVENADAVATPALLIYSDRVEENIRRMVKIAGDPKRLRPHIKTHKLPELIRLQQTHGVNKFKCATIAEAEMVAGCAAEEVLLAYQPVGPNAVRLTELIKKFPKTRFQTIADDEGVVRALARATADAGVVLEVLLDLNLGMNRCGIEPGPGAAELYRTVCGSPSLRAGGLHVYDGNITAKDLVERTAKADEAFARADRFREELENSRLPVPRMVMGGTPTFPIHAKRPAVELSPGTCVFWDAGYGMKFPDIDFIYGALVMSRVVSKPTPNRLCLDLGHKAIASENPQPRVHFLNLPENTPVMHSEEHLVLETERAGEFKVGDVIYGVPLHVCPTVNLHDRAVVVRGNKAAEVWRVVARARELTV